MLKNGTFAHFASYSLPCALLAAMLLSCSGSDDDPSSAPMAGDCDPTGDQDNDGRTDCEEVQGYMISVDVLGFGLDSDNSESRSVTSDPTRADTDGDGIDDLEEFQERIDPSSADTDSDGLTDFAELRRWRTSPRTVDSDDDATDITGRNPVTALWDANELNLVPDAEDPSRMVPGPNATDPTESDTDGDGRSDLEEFDDPIVDPVIADLPALRMELTSDPEIRLNYTTTALQGMTQSVGTTLSRDTSSSLARSDSTSTTLSAEASVTIGTEVTAGLPPSASVSASATLSTGVERSRATEVSRENTESIGRAQSQERSLSVEEGYSVTTGEITVGVELVNDGDITYRVAGLDFLVKRYDPVAQAAEPLAVLTLPDSQASGFVLQPNGRVDLLLQGLDLDAGLVQSFIRQPSALFFEPIQPDLRDENDTSFSFIDQTRGKTALIVVDDASGDEPIRLRVATNVDRRDDGARAGIALGQALDNAGVSFTVEDRDGREVVASVGGVGYQVRAGMAPDLNDPDYGSVGGPGDRAAERFWAVIGSRADEVANDFGALDVTVDFTKMRLQNRDEVRLVLVRDEDGDGVYDREEFVYGADDNDIDSDDDGLSDYFEIKVGWMSNGTRVFPSPAVDDFDEDGLVDDAERVAGTDPRNPDTDGDGVPDGIDPEPLTPAANQPPTVSNLAATLLRLTGNGGFEVRLTGDVADADGTVERIIIDWGDGQVENLDGSALDRTHVYPDLNSRTISVVARDDLGGESPAQTATVEPEPEGEILRIRFNGQVRDDGGRNVSVSGAPVYVPDHNGMANEAADFYRNNNSQEGVLASVPNLGLTGDQTIAMWVFIPNVTSQRIVGTDQGLQFYIRSQRIHFGWAERMADSSDERGPAVSASVTAGNWYHLAGVKQGTELQLYVNGASVGTVSDTNTLSTTCRFHIGTFPNDDLCTGTESQQFNNPPAYYADLRVYDRALSALQIGVISAQ